MIELNQDSLTFAFPTTHPDARLVLDFQRTLRIPGGEPEIPRLPSHGRYPLYTVDSFAHRVPRHWADSGGAILPMYQSEAMWLSFRPAYSVAHQAFYPFAIKIRVGGVDAVRGKGWSEGVHQWPQDFLVINDHCWLGGYHDERQGVQQFVAMPLGSGYLPQGPQGIGDSSGCLEIVVYPMEGGAFAMRYPRNPWPGRLEDPSVGMKDSLAANREHRGDQDVLQRQPVEEGLFPLDDWDRECPGRYTLHLANSLHWCAITGSPPPVAPSRFHTDRQPMALNSPLPRSAAEASHRTGSTSGKMGSDELEALP